MITRIELFAKPITAGEHTTIQALLDSSRAYGLTEPVIQRTIRLRRSHSCKMPDAIIAATALVHGLALVTRDGGFCTITGLSLIDPHDPASLPAIS